MRSASLLTLLVLSACAANAPAARPSPSGSMRVVVTKAEGLPVTQAQSIFRAAAGPLAHCKLGKTGKLEVRVVDRGGGLRVEIEPAASLDPTARECAIEALSRLYAEETASNVGGPSVPPTGFTSHLSLAW